MNREQLILALDMLFSIADDEEEETK